MRATEFITEADPKLKASALAAVKATDDDALLNRVIVTLKSADIDTNLTNAMTDDKDSMKFIKTIARMVIDTPGTVEEKQAFANGFKRGFIDTGMLFSGERVTFKDFVKGEFAQKVFINMAGSNELRPQGVGPGEIALAAMSPNITFTGQASGGGDIAVAGVGNVEVKARVQSAGRWGNARKARMEMGAVRKAIEDVLGEPVGDRINAKQWVRDFRPRIIEKNPRALKSVCEIMAKGTYKFAETGRLVTALQKGSTEDITYEVLQVAWENYKIYSKFDGMLLMDVNAQQAHYFEDFGDMGDNVWPSTIYLLGPEQEMFPKVGLVI